MASFRELVNAAGSDVHVLQKMAKPITDVYPTVGELLAGLPQLGEMPAIPGQRVTFWLEGTGMKCAIRHADGDTVIFVDIRDMLAPWQSIESALIGGDVSVRKEKHKRTSGLNTPY